MACVVIRLQSGGYAMNDKVGTVEHSRDEFIRLLTGEQTRLFSYIASLLGNLNDASNVLQQTNITLWRKVDEFAIGTNFHVWARKVAYYQTLAFIRDRKRDRHIFDEELLTQLASRPTEVDEDERRVALRHCLGSISEDSLELVRQRYAPGKSIAEIAKLRQKSEGAIRMGLMRIRQALIDCVKKQLAGQ
jgi:RNA polymerase sigma-70 factor, ECF subfamily